MMTKQNRIACDECGKFISIADLDAGIASHVLSLPDSEFTKETFESQCAGCMKAENERHAKVRKLMAPGIFDAQ